MPMRLSRLLLVILLFGLVALPGAHAQVASPYTVMVPVTDTGDAQRGEAFASALAQVLARLAGGQDLRSKPGYGDALKDASALVRHFQYARVAGGINLTVDFEPGAVRHLVDKLGVAGSAGARPPVLLLVSGDDGKPLDKDALASLAQTAATRGYDVAYADPTVAVDASKVAAADPATLAAVNQQYHTGLVLVGSLHGTSAQWTLVSGGKAQAWSSSDKTEDALMAGAGGAMADRIGRQLNVIGAAVSGVKLWVSNLDSAADYASLLAALRADPAVRGVTTLGAQDDGMLFLVQSAMPADALAANLAAGGRVMRGGAHAGADASLRWLHGGQ